MNHFVNWLAPHVPLTVAVLTLLLALGCLCLALARSPAHRQRIGELTVAGVLMWLILAAIPLPRLLPGSLLTLESGGPLSDGAGSAGRPAENSPGGHSAFDASAAQIADSDGPATNIFLEADVNAPVENDGQALRTAPGTYSVPYEISPVSDEVSKAVRSSAAVAPAHNKVREGGLAVTEATAIPRASGRTVRSAVLEFATWIGLAGAAAATFWLLLGHALLARERFTAAAPPAWLFRLLQRAAASSPGRLPRLVVSRGCSRPVSWGVLRPMIALPERLCHRANSDQLRTILLHELGHVRRGDARGGLLFELALPLLYFHPLYWWLRAEARMAAELVADDWAARATGKETYVAELVALARGSRQRRLALATGSGAY